VAEVIERGGKEGGVVRKEEKMLEPEVSRCLDEGFDHVFMLFIEYFTLIKRLASKWSAVCTLAVSGSDTLNGTV